MPKDFNDKSAKQTSRHSNTPPSGEFAEIIREMEALSPEERAEMLDVMESETLKGLRDVTKEFADILSMTGKPDDKTAAFFDNFADAEVLNGLHMNCEMLGYIADVKGDAAHPVIKETLKTLAELSDDDYNSPTKITLALIKGYEAGTGMQLSSGRKPNPFKKPQGPKQ